MSVRLRFKRIGKPKNPFYRLVAIDRRAARDAAELEILGHYDPRHKDNLLTFNADRVQYWLSCGAQPSDTVRSLLARSRSLSKAQTEKPETPSEKA